MDFYEIIPAIIYGACLLLGFSLLLTVLLWLSLKVWKRVLIRMKYWGDFLAYVRYRTRGERSTCVWMSEEENEWKPECCEMQYVVPFAETFVYCPFCGKPLRSCGSDSLLALSRLVSKMSP